MFDALYYFKTNDNINIVISKSDKGNEIVTLDIRTI